jgi:hypothetical protein
MAGRDVCGKEADMGFTVVHENGAKDSDHRRYLTLLGRKLLNEGVGLDRVPRTRANGDKGERWLYVWNKESDAQAFAEQLREQTEDPAWQVKAVKGRASVGPLQPLEIHVGSGVAVAAFELDPLTRWAIQLRFPSSCRRTLVVVHWDHLKDKAPAGEELRALARQVLSLLTGLEAKDLAVFGSYEVIAPRSHQVLVPPTPLVP